MTAAMRVLGASLLLLLLGVATAFAAPPTPNVFRFKVGEVEVTALSDGTIELPSDLFHDPQGADFGPLIKAQGLVAAKMTTSINAYLLKIGKTLILVDCGAAGLFGPTTGYLPKALAAAGVAPEQIDAVLLTHLHGDHVGGLQNAKGERFFPKATVYLSPAEQESTLGKDAVSRLSGRQQENAKQAQRLAAPYVLAKNWQPVGAGPLPFAGLSAVSAPGHTPGHMMVKLESQGQTLLFIGDLLHSAAIQFARPQVTVSFDFDQEQARASRLSVFAQVAKSGEAIAGAHLPFPGVGRIKAQESGYVFTPLAP